MTKNRKRGEPITLDWIKSNCIVDEETGCWLWTLGQVTGGYGSIRSQGRTHSAHRQAYQLAGGVVPPGQCVLHSCDRPLCCSPDHLSAGTHGQNAADRNAKERQARGEKHGSAKLTAEKVRLIRSSPVSWKEKAEEFGVTKQAISKIMRNQTWAHVA